MNRTTRPLVVNADDGGLHPATDRAILRCAQEGVVRSVSVIANGPTTERFVAQALDADLDVGLHLNLTEGHALSGPIEGLTDEHGSFHGTAAKAAVVSRLFEASPEVSAEVQAQWDRLGALGARITHVDGHNHVHVAPAVASALASVAAGTFVRAPVEPDGRGPRWFPVRTPTSTPTRRLDAFIGHALAPDPTLETLRASLAACRGSVEWMTHPGRRPGSAFTDCAARDDEQALLCAPEVGALLAELGFRVTSFRALLDEEGA